MTGNARSVSWVIENAASGAANAAAHNAAAGIARTAHADGMAPSTAATSRNTTLAGMLRTAVQTTKPLKMSDGESGVATTPS